MFDYILPAGYIYQVYYTTFSEVIAEDTYGYTEEQTLFSGENTNDLFGGIKSSSKLNNDEYTYAQGKTLNVNSMINSSVYRTVDTPSSYSGNIIAGKRGTADHSESTMFKFDSDTVSYDNRDGYVGIDGTLTGASSFTNISKIAIFNGCVAGTIAYINGNYITANGNIQVIDLTADGDIEIYGLRYSD